MEEEEHEETPLKEALKIREYSELPQQGVCVVCGKVKEPYVQIEYEGRVEYTCEECYKKSVEKPASRCKNCGAIVEEGDRFCGSCGTELIRSCPKCGARAASGDVYCGKCGTKL